MTAACEKIWHRVFRPLVRVEREGGGAVTIHNDQFAAVGSRRVYLPGLIELHELGLVEVKRLQKRHLLALSDRCRLPPPSMTYR